MALNTHLLTNLLTRPSATQRLDNGDDDDDEVDWNLAKLRREQVGKVGNLVLTLYGMSVSTGVSGSSS